MKVCLMWITYFLRKRVAHTHILPHCEFTQKSCDMKETRSQVKMFCICVGRH